MIRPNVAFAAALVVVALRPTGNVVRAQDWNGAQAVVDALRSNPLLLPYAIRVTPKKGAMVLSGKVGTKQVHDMAVRTVIDLGFIPKDDLVIDTAEAHRVALDQSYAGPVQGLQQRTGTSPYFVYPPPLFGRLDDPFWGFEPPILSFPPGYSRLPEPGMTYAGGPAESDRRPAAGPIKGQVQLIVDSAGQVVLSGVVATEEDRRTIEQEARSSPGVTRVFNELKVANRVDPPPPPRPIDDPEAAPHAQSPSPAEERAGKKPEAADRVTAADGGRLTGRAVQALERRSMLKDSPISVQSSNDVVTLSGEVPTAYEAMLAYRAVEQTPGVREVVDKLQYQLPDENHHNPLREKARPDDLEPYLTFHIRRHAGDVAHIDRVRVRGDVVEVRGSLLPGEDQARLAATLRSIPLLRDFRIEPSFTTD